MLNRKGNIERLKILGNYPKFSNNWVTYLLLTNQVV